MTRGTTKAGVQTYRIMVGSCVSPEKKGLPDSGRPGVPETGAPQSGSAIAEVGVAIVAGVVEVVGGRLDLVGLAGLGSLDQLLRCLLHLLGVFLPLLGALAALRLGRCILRRHLRHGRVDVAHLD